MSSRDPFAFFGLDRATANEASLKRAYAVKLKMHRPDEDPAGFIQLREAFEIVRNTLRWDAEHIAQNDEVEAYEFAPNHTEVEPVAAFSGPTNQDNTAAVYDQAVELIFEASPSFNIEALKSLLNDPSVEDIDSFARLSAAMRHFICGQTGMFAEGQDMPTYPDWLSVDKVKLLDGHFGWTRQQSYDYRDQHQNNWVSRVLRQLMLRSQQNEPEQVYARRRRRRGYSGYTPPAADMRPVQTTRVPQKSPPDESEHRWIGYLSRGFLIVMVVSWFIRALANAS